jgi:hypothetical protein
MKTKVSIWLAFWLVLFTAGSCEKDPLVNTNRSRNVVIVVVDGPRWSETWGDPERQYIPRRALQLAPLGTLCVNMHNEGKTSTNPGHLALTRGVYQLINNSGEEYPEAPSFMQRWLKLTGYPAEKAWIIASKDKLEVMGNCTDPEWQGLYLPRTDCGINGLGTGYRHDTITLQRVLSVMQDHRPNIMVVNFKEPDGAGHFANWNNYLQGIMDTDEYCYRIWQRIQSDPYYKDVTTMLITNDHGRHPDGHLDGFVSHGDTCAGCRHIELLAIGPDIKAGKVDMQYHSQVDIAVTAAQLMGVKLKDVEGRMLHELIK